MISNIQAQLHMENVEYMKSGNDLNTGQTKNNP